MEKAEWGTTEDELTCSGHENDRNPARSSGAKVREGDTAILGGGGEQSAGGLLLAITSIKELSA
jgi:hypothetical protein